MVRWRKRQKGRHSAEGHRAIELLNNEIHLKISIFEPRREKTRSSAFLTRSDTNQPVQSQKQDRSLKIWIQEEEKLYYSCSENKGADQLRSYCEVELLFCFRTGKTPAQLISDNQVFSI